MKNIFCNQVDLKSEADVESLFIDRLLAKLKFPDNRILRKNSLDILKIPKSSKKEPYRPDYVLLDRKEFPVVVIDAKSPKEKPANYHYQVSGYALLLNQKYEEFNPVKYTVLTNGLLLLVYPWDSNKPILNLHFHEFEEDNPKFVELRSLLSYSSLDIVQATKDVFEFIRPNLNELVNIFIQCHNLIWKKEKMGPTDAFYEFAKLMFVKLREDHRIAKMIVTGVMNHTSADTGCPVVSFSLSTS